MSRLEKWAWVERCETDSRRKSSRDAFWTKNSLDSQGHDESQIVGHLAVRIKMREFR